MVIINCGAPTPTPPDKTAEVGVVCAQLTARSRVCCFGRVLLGIARARQRRVGVCFLFSLPEWETERTSGRGDW